MNSEFQVAALDNPKPCAHFTEIGMEGVDRKNANRPVSMISLQARQAVDQAPENGLCYKKFVADITLECEEMPPKNALLKSGDLLLGILPERKRCWPECELLEKKLSCPLIDGVLYASVEKPGELCVGDAFTIIPSKE